MDDEEQKESYSWMKETKIKKSRITTNYDKKGPNEESSKGESIMMESPSMLAINSATKESRKEGAVMRSREEDAIWEELGDKIKALAWE